MRANGSYTVFFWCILQVILQDVKILRAYVDGACRCEDEGSNCQVAVQSGRKGKIDSEDPESGRARDCTAGSRFKSGLEEIDSALSIS